MTADLAIVEVGVPSAARVLAAMPHPVLVIDPDGFICYANDGAELLMGVGRTVLRTKRLDEFVGPTSPVLRLVDGVREGFAISQRAVPWPVAGTRHARDVDVDGAPLAPDLVVLVIQERSIAGKIDRQLTHRGAARSVSALASMLAHEIKNPLSGIRGAAQLLERACEGEDRELAKLVRTETDRIVKLVNTMEVFSDERPTARTSVNMHSVFDQVISIARNGFAAETEIAEDYDPSLPNVHANHDQMVQVFLNLVKNAVEATSDVDKPLVSLRSSFRAGIRMALPGAAGQTALPLEFSVSDNGGGVPADMAEHLFDPFVTTKRNGSGLGLALVAKLVRDHGGVVDFQSDRGHTTFKVLLPIWSGET